MPADRWEDVIAQTIARLLIPMILLYGIYVIFHGHLSPGGGFQGGVILASSVILYSLVHELDQATKFFKKKFRVILEPIGPIIFAFIGLLCIFFSGNFIQYSKLPFLGDKEMAAVSITIIEAGIGVTVMAMVISIFFSLGGRNR
ncbi:MAG: Multisubunit Na+/H+ antiporter MnhB subunit [Candidatus Methanohalarchaeum thermophilum]|uniref:Multisubunit Na+/H+ antiporter MnhB subunit n=1 Tax=Methanohalarchaeum thermophilum TaxID=1903181 RepID=A0A1Q6DUS6_METT1|nr:MAG: Multisubunit Na+/H+ antiporter MnhB subunit [Candidatus Methanohalarchaeum thermophilum]